MATGEAMLREAAQREGGRPDTGWGRVRFHAADGLPLESIAMPLARDPVGAAAATGARTRGAAAAARNVTPQVRSAAR